MLSYIAVEFRAMDSDGFQTKSYPAEAIGDGTKTP